MKKRLVSLMLIWLVVVLLIPAVANANEPICWPPEEWRAEYNVWVAWQQYLQQQFTNDTGYGLGALLGFSQWAEMRAKNEPYWWKPVPKEEPNPIPQPVYKIGYKRLFCDSHGNKAAYQSKWRLIHRIR